MIHVIRTYLTDLFSTHVLSQSQDRENIHCPFYGVLINRQFVRTFRPDDKRMLFLYFVRRIWTNANDQCFNDAGIILNMTDDVFIKGIEQVLNELWASVD
jgi:hypothetical protein